MKKNFFLTLMLAVLCTATSWAQFNPVEGKAYALKFQNYDLYVDIQTKGYADYNDANCISASFSPTKIYFEVGTDGKWKIKNANGEYIGIGNSSWNVAIEKETQWTIDAEESVITISAGDGYIGVDTPKDGGILYSNTSKNYWFEVLEYDKLTHSTVYTTFKAVKIGKDTHIYDTYLNTTASSSTAVSFQREATKFRLIRMGDAYCIRLNDSEQPQYLAQVQNGADTWNVSITTEPYLWKVLDEDGDGDFIISKNSEDSHRLGSDGSTSEGTGIYANVGTDCNEWILEECIDYDNSKPTFTDETAAIKSNGQYLTALELDGTTVLSGLTEPNNVEDMYVVAPLPGVSLERGCEYTFSLTFPKNKTNQILVANLWFDKDGDGTFETHLGTTGTANSNSNDISIVKFTIPADASLLLTHIRLRLDSSWKIAENANDDANRMVYDIPVTIAQASAYTFKIENPSGEAVNVTYNGNAIQDGDEISGGINVALFSTDEIEGYTWRVVVDSKAKTVTLVYEKLYSLSLVDAPEGTAVKYNETDVTTGSFLGLIVDSQQLSVECPQGYTWEISADNEKKVVSITFKQLARVENPEAVVALIKRVGGKSAAGKFKFVLEPSLNYDKEVFVIGSEDGKVLIKGTTISAITTGIGWYLNNYAHINIAWNSLNEKTVSGDKYADLSNIPVPTTTETRTSDAMYRYYLNTCTFGYSMTSWTWKRWQQEIDWMALHGINMPLQLVGMEEVWRKFLTMEENGARKYGYTDAEAKAFVAGPAFIAWWAMNNLEGWGGTAPGSKSGYNNLAGAGGVQDDAWYARQKALAKQITDRQRELGMQPVLPGWSGMVPTNFASKSGYATRANGGNWAGDFVRPLLLNVSNANYAEIAADYYKCLHEVMGESQYYSMDPFHEGGGAGTTEDYKALYAAMEAAKPGSQWVIQQWQWSPTQKLSLTAVPAGRLVVLDLFSDGSPAFDGYSGYTPQDAVFCAIPNFGGRSGLMGRLNNVTDNYFKFKGKYASIKGIGTAPEAIEQTPVAYDLIFQLPWMGTKPDVAEWVKNYSVARYGVANTELQAAWELLRQGVLNYGADGIQGPVEDVWAARPNLDANHASFWGKTLNDAMGTYTKERQQMLIDAVHKLLEQNATLAFESGSVYESNYNYDIVEFGGAVMADYAYYLLLGIRDAKNAGGLDDAKYIARRDAFLQIIRDMDKFRGTNLNFRLGKWTQEARAAAAEVENATTATPDWYEYNNARTILTTWSSPGTNLNDYSYRSWQGLLMDVYLPRWEAYFDNNCNGLEYKFFEWNWAHGMKHEVGQTAISTEPLSKGDKGHTDSYTREPEGNTVDEAKAMLGKYIIPVKVADGTYYAYRYLENDIRKTLTLSVNEGSTLNLSDYFGELNDVTITAGCIEGEVNDAANVVIKSGSANGTTAKYDVNIAFNDGTVIKFALVVNTAEFAVEKEGLAKLIEDMKELTAQVGTFNPVGSKTKVTLQTKASNANYIWTNAQSSNEGPIANLIDGQTGTHFHTDYSAGNQTPGSHYIAIDLGEGNTLGRFTFDYTTRNGGTGDFPDKIVVYASNDRDANYEEIAVITEPVFPQKTNTKWELGDALYTNKRYLRFNVYAERGYWHMSEFNIYNNTRATADVFDAYSGAELTDDFVAEKYNVLLDAIIAYDNATTKDEITAKKDALQTAYNQLKEKMDAALPFTLTTDENAPVLYKIFIERTSGTTVLKYDENTKLVAVQNKADNSSWQAWYFMQGESGLLIKPFNADGKALAADDTGNGAGKVSASVVGEKKYNEWCLRKQGDDGCYNIYINDNGTKKYFSNFGGDSNKMGFWNGDGTESKTQGDAGSKFKFLDVEFSEDNARYYQLSDVLAAMPVGTNMMSGDAPGCYPGGDDYYTAYTTASGLKDAGSTASKSDACFAAYKELRAAKASLGEMIMPEDGKIYRIKNLITKADEGKRIHYLSAGATKFPKVTDQTTRWKCIKDGETYKFVYEKNESVVLAWRNIASGGEAQAFTIKPGVERGAVCLANGTINLALTNESFNGGLNFNQASDNGKVQETTWSTDWYLEPVGEYPFAITTDEDAPVLYNIFIKRDLDNESGVALLEYDESDGKIAVRKTAANNSWQAWYFMKSDNGFTAHPYNACGKVIGANNTGNAAATVSVAKKDEHTCDEWKVVERTDNYWNIQAHDGSNYFSNNGGVGNKMGFWSSEPDTDGGSLFKFVEAEFENDNARYYQLSDVKAEMPDGTNIYGGTSVGLYTGGKEYREAYAAAATLVSEGNTSDSDECYDAYAGLRAAKEALVYNAADPAKVYYIVSAATNSNCSYCAGKYVHTLKEPNGGYNHKHLKFSDFKDIANKTLAAFQFEPTATQGEYKMKNLHTGLYMKSYNKNVEHMGDFANAATVKIIGYADGQIILKIGNNRPMHAQDANKVIVDWDAAKGNASLWTINEATDLTVFDYTLAVPESGVATLNLAFNVQLPDGVEAYYMTNDFVAVGGESGRYKYNGLELLATGGDILAKNTPVIIKAAPGNYTFAFTMNDEAEKVAADASVLRGGLWQTTVPAATDEKVCYTLDAAAAVPAFDIAANDVTVAANQCWMELAENKGDVIYEYRVDYPVVGNVYRIRNYAANIVGTDNNHYLVNSDVNISMPASVAENDRNAMWLCVSGDEDTHKYKFVSVLGTASLGWNGVAEVAAEYEITTGIEYAALTLTNAEKNLALSYGDAVTFNQQSNAIKTQREDLSTDWFLEPVADTEVSYSRTFGRGTAWGTLILPYAVEVPEGVSAYYATIDAVGEKVISLTDVGSVIPAHEAVLINRGEENKTATANFDFVYTTETPEVDVEGNIFVGNVIANLVKCEEGRRYYQLFNGGKGEAFYWIFDEYDENGDVHTGEHRGYIKCEANKAYLSIGAEANVSSSSSYSFRFDGTTGVEDVKTESGEVKAIYDLQGRKLTEVTKSGFYIVDGEKVLVK